MLCLCLLTHSLFISFYYYWLFCVLYKGEVLINCLLQLTLTSSVSLQLPPFSGQFVKLVLHVNCSFRWTWFIFTWINVNCIFCTCLPGNKRDWLIFFISIMHSAVFFPNSMLTPLLLLFVIWKGYELSGEIALKNNHYYFIIKDVFVLKERSSVRVQE